MRRSLVLLIAVMAIPVATAWAAFGDPEVADPTFFVDNTIPEQLQVDGDGRAYFVSQEIVPIGDPDDADTDRQVVVYERCGTAWQVDSRHGLERRPGLRDAADLARGVAVRRHAPDLARRGLPRAGRSSRASAPRAATGARPRRWRRCR